MASFQRATLLAFLCALALLGRTTAQPAPASPEEPAAPEDVVKAQCGISSVPVVNQTLLQTVLSKCGPTQNLADSSVCDACGCAGEPVLAALAPAIIKETMVASWEQLSEDCRLILSLYTLFKANVTTDRGDELVQTCGESSNKGLWNLDALDTAC